MPSRADLEAYRADNARVRRLALAELQGFWSTLNLSDATRVAREAEAFLPLLIRQYGDVAMTVAADFYETQREAAGVAGRFTAVLGDGAPPAAAEASARWAVGPLFGDSPDGTSALGRLGVALDRLSLQDGRRVIHDSMARDPAQGRVARVPTGPSTCAFCLMLASRGPVYESIESAGGGDAGKYHANDDCVPTPVWSDTDLPSDYLPEELYARYEQARQRADSGSPKAILAALREQEGIN